MKVKIFEKESSLPLIAIQVVAAVLGGATKRKRTGWSWEPRGVFDGNLM